jgi:2-amino-4-hydroxy-6-hydroxymethyldihydropteridine diphosphokinase
MIPVYLARFKLDDRENISNGIRGLASRGIDIIRSSGVYSTNRWKFSINPGFERCAGNPYSFAPERYSTCLSREENHRTRDKLRVREHDIDIIFYGSQIIHRPDLVIPHPRFAARRFVLAPLADIAPDFVDPLSGKTIRELLESCPDQSSVQLQTGPLQ